MKIYWSIINFFIQLWVKILIWTNKFPDTVKPVEGKLTNHLDFREIKPLRLEPQKFLHRESEFDQKAFIANEIRKSPYKGWYYIHESNWGSVRDISCSTRDGFSQNPDGGVTVHSKRGEATGHNWQGEPVECEYIGGEIWSSQRYDDDIFETELKFHAYKGNLLGFWLFFENGGKYEEFDIEIFCHDNSDKDNISITIHWKNGKRHMYCRTIKIPNTSAFHNYRFYIDRKRNRIMMKINGILIYKTSMGVPAEAVYVCQSVFVKDWGGFTPSAVISKWLKTYKL